jgi:hypothetical protein
VHITSNGIGELFARNSAERRSLEGMSSTSLTNSVAA